MRKSTKRVKRNFVYLMVCVSGDPEERDVEKRMRSRCCGYYVNKRDAVKAIECNATDMSECAYYQYAVVVKQGEGPLSIGDEVQWYEFIWTWDVPPREHDGLIIPEFVRAEKIEKPKAYQQIFFGM